MESSPFLPFCGTFYKNHFRSGDHLRSNLGIISRPGIICGPVYIYISLKVSATLPSNSKKQSMNWRQTKGRLLGSNRLEDRLASGLLEQNLHTSGKFCVQCRIKFQLRCSSIFTGWKYLCRIFSLSYRNLFCERLHWRNYMFCGRSKIISVGNEFIEHDIAARPLYIWSGQK